MKENKKEYSKVKSGHVALFFDGTLVSGECRFTAVKTKPKNGEAIFNITLIKSL